MQATAESTTHEKILFFSFIFLAPKAVIHMRLNSSVLGQVSAGSDIVRQRKASPPPFLIHWNVIHLLLSGCKHEQEVSLTRR